MRDLVEGVKSYPEFLPWCGEAKVLSIDKDVTRARIQIRYHGLNAAFTTENLRRSEQVIEMTLVEGPFRVLQGVWQFDELRENACRVEFKLEYEFSNKVLGIVAGPVFHKISDTLVDAFVRRADSLYRALT
jgi:ribosome-associated toxin RatA of RatAB toxin-antitoxin module